MNLYRPKLWKHVAAVAARFELHIYQNASGHDYIVSAYITAGKEPPVLIASVVHLYV